MAASLHITPTCDDQTRAIIEIDGGIFVAAVPQISAYDEVVDFLTSEPTPEQIIAFRPSSAVQEHVKSLLEANGNNTLGRDEQSELDEFEEIEHLMRRLKFVPALNSRRHNVHVGH